MFTSSHMVKQKKFDNYKKEQVIAVAEWLINVIQQEIPRINAIKDADMNDNAFLEKQLRKNILVYGDHIDLPFNSLSEEKKDKFRASFIEAVWNICETDALQNMVDSIHVSCVPGEGCPEIQKILFSALDAASLSKKLFEDLFVGCYMKKNGQVDAYVKIGYYEPAIHKDIYDHNVVNKLRNN